MGEYLSGLITRDQLQRAIDAYAPHARREELSRSDQFVARPSEKRNQMKDALKDQYWSSQTAEVRVRAERAYNRFLEAAEQS